MEFYTIPPPQYLAEFVQFYWVLEGKASPKHPFIHRVLADPCPELLFYYKGNFKRYTNSLKPEEIFTCRIYGQTQKISRFETNTDFSIFGVCLYPHALPLLFGLPSSELTDQLTDLTTLLGKSGGILEEQMMLATDNTHRAQLVSQFLTNRLTKLQQSYLPVVNVIKSILNSCQPFSINSLAENCFLSRRQFERKFKEYSGFSPKLFSIIVRFNTIVKEAPLSESLIQTAFNYGYYDQAHFAHEFHRFSGYTPKEFFKHLPENSNYRATVEFKK